MKYHGQSLTSASLSIYAANLSRLAPVFPFVDTINYWDLEAYADRIPADFWPNSED